MATLQEQRPVTPDPNRKPGLLRQITTEPLPDKPVGQIARGVVGFCITAHTPVTWPLAALFAVDATVGTGRAIGEGVRRVVAKANESRARRQLPPPPRRG